MSKKFLGIKAPFEWYDARVKFKQLIRKFLYSWLIQSFVSWIIVGYMYFFYITSRKKFINLDPALKEVAQNKPLIILCWHNRLMLAPFFSRAINRSYPNYQFMSLVSKHGDGRFVGKVMAKMGFAPIFGSTQRGRKSSRGIGIDAIRQIFSGLKNGRAIAITPDGPRGPNQKINGDVANIARISGAKILAMSCSSSRFKVLNSWDKFKIPLPFSKITYYCHDQLFAIDRSATKKDLEEIKIKIEKSLNNSQDKSALFNK